MEAENLGEGGGGGGAGGQNQEEHPRLCILPLLDLVVRERREGETAVFSVDGSGRCTGVMGGLLHYDFCTDQVRRSRETIYESHCNLW